MKKLLFSVALLIGFNNAHALSDHHRNVLMELRGLPSSQKDDLVKLLLCHACGFNSLDDLTDESHTEEFFRRIFTNAKCEQFINKTATVYGITGYYAKKAREDAMNSYPSTPNSMNTYPPTPNSMNTYPSTPNAMNQYPPNAFTMNQHEDPYTEALKTAQMNQK